MAVAYNSSIVTDGLVLCLDAANPRSYPGSGTTWNDLSGRGNNGTLTNGPTYNSSNNGSIVFDGANDYINLTNTSNLNITTNDFTFDVVVYYERSANLYAKAASRGNYLSAGWTIYMGYNNTEDGFTFAYGTSFPQSVIGYHKIEQNRWYHFCITRLNGEMSVYNNANLIEKKIDTYNFDSTFSTILGASTGGGGFGITEVWKGRIASFKQYNIGLNHNQVIQNFNALRGRFGI